jgi:hypothetical protein
MQSSGPRSTAPVKDETGSPTGPRRPATSRGTSERRTPGSFPPEWKGGGYDNVHLYLDTGS